MNLEFDGYYYQANKMPEESGIYLVYRGKLKPNNLCDLNKLIYIGQSINLKERIQSHINDKDLDNNLKENELLLFSYVKVNQSMLDCIEKALIYTQKPCANTNNKYSYNYGKINLNISGACAYLESCCNYLKGISISLCND